MCARENNEVFAATQLFEKEHMLYHDWTIDCTNTLPACIACFRFSFEAIVIFPINNLN